MNSIKNKMRTFNSKNKFEESLEQMRQKHKYDPRPDLSEDHEYWIQVLKVAEKYDSQTYGNLHGFRCVGCRLEYIDGQFKLKPGPNSWPDHETWMKDREKYLLPYKSIIKKVFEEAAKTFQGSTIK
ncbi:MAG: hypothetical protein ACOCQA_00330 [bacterium]